MPILVCASSARSKRETDPLEALLKEKRRVDKRGGGEDALCAAEAAISSSSKEKKAWAKANLMREMEEEDSSDVDPAWMDEHAAMDVVKKSARRFKSRSSTPGLNFDEDSDDESDGELEEERQQALKELGQEGAQKVGHILSGNRLLREAMSKVKLRDRVLGVPLWDDSPNADGDDAMEVDCLPVLSFGEADIQAHPLLGMLQDATLQEGPFASLSVALCTDDINGRYVAVGHAIALWRAFNITTCACCDASSLAICDWCVMITPATWLYANDDECSG